MNKSFNEISYRILNIIRPKLSDDESIDILEVKYDVENVRAMLVKRRYSNNFKSSISDALTQFIPKLEIINTNSSLAYPTIPSDKVLMRTSLKIPEFIYKTSGMPLIKRISASTVSSNNFSFVTPEQATVSGNGKFNQNKIYCFRENDYIYLVTNRTVNKGLKYIDIDAIWEIPTVVNEFLRVNTDLDIITDNDPYPIALDMITDLEGIIIKDKLRIESSQPIDDINDSSGTINQVITK